MKEQRTHTLPLYLYSNGQKQRLSVEPLQADAGWQLEKELGYVYTSPVDGAIPLYEAANENDYCYTTEDKQEYGIAGSWKKRTNRNETDQYKKDKCSDSAVFYPWLYHYHIRIVMIKEKTI